MKLLPGSTHSLYRTRSLQRSLIVFVMAVCVASCASYTPYSSSETGEAVLSDGIAVLGVVAEGARLRDFRQRALSLEMEAQIRANNPGVRIVSHKQLLRLLANADPELHRNILDRYWEYNGLHREDLSLLRQAGLDTRYVVLLRIVRDETQLQKPYATPVRDRQGEQLLDQHEVTLTHKRIVEVSAVMLDLQNGNQRWSGGFVTEPANSRRYTRYTGSSFAGSMATMLTNSFLNGRKSTKPPPAPSSTDALKEIFEHISTVLLGTRAGLELFDKPGSASTTRI